jgi:MFS transporter, DHA2 family, triacylglyceride efflux pump
MVTRGMGTGRLVGPGAASNPSASTADRKRLVLACIAILLTAADTYVVVVVLPNIMDGVGLTLDRLQRATPIISGFLLGYTAVLPLIGRIADLAGTAPTFAWCLGAFATGSVITATAHSLPVVVLGRALQGVGGGGLVPVTMAMVAARWPPDDRGTALGVVGAVQELGSVIGPLYGAAIVAVAAWRAIFWVNVPITIVLAIGFGWVARSERRAKVEAEGGGAPGGAGGVAAVGGVAAGGVAAVGGVAAGGVAAVGSMAAVGGMAASGAGAAGPVGVAPGGVAPGGVAAVDPAVAGRRGRRRDFVGPLLGLAGAVVLIVGLDAPATLATSPSWGQLYTPMAGGQWAPFTTPMVIIAFGLLVAAAGWELLAPGSFDPVMPLRRVPALLAQSDLPGALLLAGVLACIVIMFSTADPSRQVLASSAPVVLPLAVVLTVAFWWRQRRAAVPLIEPGAFARRPAWGGFLVNLTLGGGLMAALVDIPLFARSTVYPGSETSAALVLLRFLVAVPIGAVLGGVLCRHRGRAAYVGAAGMALSTIAFISMSSWSATALGGGVRVSDVALVVCGLGFGLAVAPVNVAVLGAVDPRHHALGSAFAVVARTIGMMAGLSALTAVALRRFYEASARIGSPLQLCPTHPESCPAYDQASTAAIVSELHTIFAGAAVCTAVAGVLALVLLRTESGSPGGVAESG